MKNLDEKLYFEKLCAAEEAEESKQSEWARKTSAEVACAIPWTWRSGRKTLCTEMSSMIDSERVKSKKLVKALQRIADRNNTPTTEAMMSVAYDALAEYKKENER